MISAIEREGEELVLRIECSDLALYAVFDQLERMQLLPHLTHGGTVLPHYYQQHENYRTPGLTVGTPGLKVGTTWLDLQCVAD